VSRYLFQRWSEPWLSLMTLVFDAPFNLYMLRLLAAISSETPALEDYLLLLKLFVPDCLELRKEPSVSLLILSKSSFLFLI